MLCSYPFSQKHKAELDFFISDSIVLCFDVICDDSEEAVQAHGQ